MMGRTIAIGDIHGCLQEDLKLLKNLGLIANAGRGPDGG